MLPTQADRDQAKTDLSQKEVENAHLRKYNESLRDEIDVLSGKIGLVVSGILDKPRKSTQTDFDESETLLAVKAVELKKQRDAAQVRC